MDDSDFVICGLNILPRKGVILHKYSVVAKELLNWRTVTTRKTAITCLDVRGPFIALATSDQSVTLASSSNLKPINDQKDVHSFVITSLSFNDDASLLASTSVANTVHITSIPADSVASFHRGRRTVLWTLLSLAVLVGFAILLGSFVEYRLIDDLMKPPRELASEWLPIEKILEGVRTKGNDESVQVPSVTQHVIETVNVPDVVDDTVQFTVSVEDSVIIDELPSDNEGSQPPQDEPIGSQNPSSHDEL